MMMNQDERSGRAGSPPLYRGPAGGGCGADHEVWRGVYAGVRVGACRGCREVRFRGTEEGAADPWEALGELFGDFRLVGRIDTIRAPAAEVLAYRPRRPEDASALGVTPPHRWFKAADRLWMCHDGSLLLLAHESAHASKAVGA